MKKIPQPIIQFLRSAWESPQHVADALCLDMDSSGKVLCPFHDDTVPSASIIMGEKGPWFYCHSQACDASMGILKLVAQRSGLDIKEDFQKVLAQTAMLLDHPELVPVIMGRRGAKVDLSAIKKRVAEHAATRVETRSYPEDAGVFYVMHTKPVDSNRLVRKHLSERKLSSKLIAKYDLARTWDYDEKFKPKWAKSGRGNWGETLHILIVALVDENGYILSVRVRCVIPCNPQYKSLAPDGSLTKHLIFANETARQMLNPQTSIGKLAEGKMLLLVVTEGEIDFLTWATQQAPEDTSMAVIGLISGSWHEGFAKRIPDGTTVILRTDHDTAGDNYAETVRASLQGRCRVLRSVGEEGTDENDLLKAGKLPADPRDGCLEVEK